MKKWSAYLTHAPEILTCCRETAQWPALTLAYLGLRPLRYPYELRLRSGQHITLWEPTDVRVFWLVFARRHYPVHPADRIIIDLGANIGMFTLYAAREAPQSRIVAIEPFPDTRSRLQSLVERNQLQDRVTILDYAVAASSATGSMDDALEVPSQYRRIYSEATKVLNVNHRNRVNQSEDGVVVKTETLENLLDCANVHTGDLIKMNIHGSEYEVLMSASPAALKRCKKIVVQYHEFPADRHLGKRELFGYMAANGFELVSDRDSHRGAGLALFARGT